MKVKKKNVILKSVFPSAIRGTVPFNNLGVKSVQSYQSDPAVVECKPFLIIPDSCTVVSASKISAVVHNRVQFICLILMTAGKNKAQEKEMSSDKKVYILCTSGICRVRGTSTVWLILTYVM